MHLFDSKMCLGLPSQQTNLPLKQFSPIEKGPLQQMLAIQTTVLLLLIAAVHMLHRCSPLLVSEFYLWWALLLSHLHAPCRPCLSVAGVSYSSISLLPVLFVCEVLCRQAIFHFTLIGYEACKTVSFDNCMVLAFKI